MSIDVPARARADIDFASEDLGEQYGPATALLFQERLTRTLRRLERFPLSGTLVDPPYPRFPGMRLVPVYRFDHRIVYYVPTSTGIRVVRVIHASLDADALFG